MVIDRHINRRVIEALEDTPVLYRQGARQTGKSTLVRMIAEGAHLARYDTLDEAAILSAAQADPEGFGLRASRSGGH